MTAKDDPYDTPQPSNCKDHDPVNHPSHYTQGSIECKDAMVAAFGQEKYETFCKLNAFKYMWRSDLKGNPDQDLEKARWYLKQIKTERPTPTPEYKIDGKPLQYGNIGDGYEYERTYLSLY